MLAFFLSCLIPTSVAFLFSGFFFSSYLNRNMLFIVRCLQPRHGVLSSVEHALPLGHFVHFSFRWIFCARSKFFIFFLCCLLDCPCLPAWLLLHLFYGLLFVLSATSSALACLGLLADRPFGQPIHISAPFLPKSNTNGIKFPFACLPNVGYLPYSHN